MHLPVITQDVINIRLKNLWEIWLQNFCWLL